MDAQPEHALVYGRLCDREGRLLDLCLCTVSRGPNSYTGEDTAEFQCHGSPVVLRTLLEELFALGARQAGPGEFTKRAFLNGRMELCAAEAVADIIDAETAEAARNAAGQLSGAIGQRVGATIRTRISRTSVSPPMQESWTLPLRTCALCWAAFRAAGSSSPASRRCWWAGRTPARAPC